MSENKTFKIKQKINLGLGDVIGIACFVVIAYVYGKAKFDDVMFVLKHSHAVPTSYATSPIDISSEPYQDWAPEKYEDIKIKGYFSNNNYLLINNARYSIAGMIVAKNKKFGIAGISKSNFDDVALIDFGITWGEAADKSLITKNVKFKSKKTLYSARQLTTKPKHSNLTQEEAEIFWKIDGSTSHTHLIPANKNVMSAMLKAKKYNIIKLDGYLVDIQMPDGHVALTSSSRNDSNPTSRGAMDGSPNKYGGSCEIMYVTSVQLGEKIYE